MDRNGRPTPGGFIPGPVGGRPGAAGPPAGMGSPWEQGYWEAYGTGKVRRPKDILYRPFHRVRYSPWLQELRCLMEEMKEQWGLMFNEMLHHKVFFVKRPAYTEQPFFALPVVKLVNADLVGPEATFTDLWRYKIPGRHAVVITGLGMDVDNPAAVAAFSPVWKILFAGEEISLFDDNTNPAFYAGGPVIDSSFRNPIGTFAHPLDLLSHGVQQRLKAEADTELVFQAMNPLASTVRIRAIMTFFVYRYEHADEFEQSEYIK